LRTLPFLPEFHDKVRRGLKTATARSRPYGKPGDRLQGPGCVLVLEHVAKAPLQYVAAECYGFEGLPSTAAFIEVWERIHPRAGYDPAKWVYLHRFHAEGNPPACEKGWDLEPVEARIEWNRRLGGWAPVWNDEAAQAVQEESS
jgi:hypothetical protein